MAEPPCGIGVRAVTKYHWRVRSCCDSDMGLLWHLNTMPANKMPNKVQKSIWAVCIVKHCTQKMTVVVAFLHTYMHCTEKIDIQERILS